MRLLTEFVCLYTYEFWLSLCKIVRKLLQNQDSYSLQKPVRRSYKRARIIVYGINDQFDADLADVSNENDSVKDWGKIYIRTCKTK